MLNIGDKFGGGVIFYVFPDGLTALVAAVEDQFEPMQWGDYIITIWYNETTFTGYRIPMVILPQAIGDGTTNTDNIASLIAADGDHPNAARSCKELELNGFSDWYLPSRDELLALMSKQTEVGGFYRNTRYISSTQGIPDPKRPTYYTPFCVDANTPNSAYADADTFQKVNVRPIRTASISDPIGPIKPAKPFLRVNNGYDTENSLPWPLTAQMQFSLDDSEWEFYTNAGLNSSHLSGNHTLSFRYPAEGINPPSDAAVFLYTAAVVDPVDPIDPEVPGEPTEPGTHTFSIAQLVARFNHYAVNLKEIKHNAAIRNQTRFFHVDLESIQVALTEGANFPALFLQTPDVDKAGTYDNMSEQYGFTYVIIMPLHKQQKAELIDTCKLISDKIYNRLMLDVANETIPGMIDGSNEGIFGPVGDGLYGWAKSIAISDAYNAEVTPNDWEDLA